MFFAHSANSEGNYHDLEAHLKGTASLDREFAEKFDASQRERYRAHKDKDGRIDLLKYHLELVAQRASEYCKAFGMADEAYVAGLLHDLGKYGDLFQRRLDGIETGIDHWSAGACEALSRYQAKGVALALTIQGHHIGIQASDPDSIRGLDYVKLADAHPFKLRLSEPNMKILLQRLETDGIALTPSVSPKYSWTPKYPVATMLDIRMLFSALTDADFIETEAFFNGTGSKLQYRESGPSLEAKASLDCLLAHLNNVATHSAASTHVNRLRADLLQACVEAAGQPQGIFTLTAPTGTGKTLAMLAFALKHAVHQSLRRVIVVIPYLSIIEQSVKQYHNVFKAFPENLGNLIIEDHSMAGVRFKEDEKHDDESTYTRGFLTQNWDAPVVVTTSVQFLESLFANRPGACRKLHRLAESVVLFDEVQTLPMSLTIPTLAALSRLVERFRSTVVFATATQPAFSSLDKHVRSHCVKGWVPNRIINTELEADLFARARRTKIEWPDLTRATSWQELATQLMGHTQVLAIVNLKRHALSLYDELKQHGESDLFHLSTNMCPAHRQQMLEEIRQRLDKKQPCRLVSTQCIEAGVDIDFPTVYRALGPLDAIAQAAGRCNRNGLAPLQKVYVFMPDDDSYPDGTYKQATGVTRLLLHERGTDGIDINNPELYREYYSRLYNFNQPENAKPLLTDALIRQNFVEVAQYYRLIAEDTINVLVPYEKSVFSELKAASNGGLKKEWIAKARPYTVSLFRPRPSDHVLPYLDPVPLTYSVRSDDWFIYLKEEHYDQKRGLVVPESSRCLIG